MRDRDVRPAVHAWLAEHAGQGAVLREEFGLCNGEARADLAAFTLERSTGVEIKSPRDRLDRLTRQVTFYDQIFDYSWLATTDHHQHAAAPLLPPWWGILHAHPTPTGTLDLKVERPAQPNPVLDPLALARLLWRDEARAELARLGHRGTSRLPRHRLWQHLAAALPAEEVAHRVRETLTTRPHTHS